MSALLLLGDGFPENGTTASEEEGGVRRRSKVEFGSGSEVLEAEEAVCASGARM